MLIILNLCLLFVPTNIFINLKENNYEIFKKNKKIVILISVGVLLILSGILSWNLYFSKFKIFKDNENLFLETVERYYSMNSNYLPEKNGTREMTLQKLYEGHHITDLYVPKTKKLCDSNSWVRVYQDENGKFSYTTYLKCGKFKSNVDIQVQKLP